MANLTGIELLSCLRKTGSTSALIDTDEKLFTESDELSAFTWLVNYVREYKTFPAAKVFTRHTRIETVLTREPLDYYVQRARNRYLYKSMLPVLQTFARGMEAKDMELVLDTLANAAGVASSIRHRDNSYVTLHSAMQEVIEDYAVAQFNPGLRGIASWWPEVDAITGGWQNSDLITVVGRPARGKSWLLLLNAYAAWKAGKSVLFLSMEMSTLQLARRLLGLHANINTNFIAKGQLSTYAYRQITGAMQDFNGGVPFSLVAGNFKRSTVVIETLCNQLSPDIIFVDASYLLTPNKKRYGSSNRRETVSDVVEELKAIAIETNRPLVQSVQFNRDADTRSSGQYSPISHLSLAKIGETDIIGQTSSIVLGVELFEQPYARDRRYIGFLKGREGESGHWPIHYTFTPMNFSVIHTLNTAAPEINFNWRGE